MSRAAGRISEVISGAPSSRDLVDSDRIALWRHLYDLVAAAKVPIETYLEPTWLNDLYQQALAIAAKVQGASKDRVFSSSLPGDVADLAALHAQTEILGSFKTECHHVGKLLGFDITT